MNESFRSNTEDREAGISLIEVIVAFVVFALIAAALIPALILSVQNATRNAAIATAAQLANERIEEIRGASNSRTCGELHDEVVSQYRYFTDDRGTRYRVDSTMADPSADPSAGVGILGSDCDADFVQVTIIVNTVKDDGSVYSHPNLPFPVISTVTETYLPMHFRSS